MSPRYINYYEESDVSASDSVGFFLLVAPSGFLLCILKVDDLELLRECPVKKRVELKYSLINGTV